MAEILVLGISHYPPLTGTDERMAAILKRMLQNPKLPAHLRTPDGWPAQMRAEWGEDEGTASAASHRAALVGWMEKTRAALDDFKPDFVLIWGDDQYENFREDIIPPYCISAYEKFNFSPPANNVWGETDKTYRLAATARRRRCWRPPARGRASTPPTPTSRCIIRWATPSPTQSSISTIIGKDFIIRSCRSRSTATAAKSSPSAAACQSFDREIAALDLDPPAPAPWRLFDLGAATARILAKSPYRVALLASSGWSHAFLTGKNHYLYPDTPADREMYDHLRRRLRRLAQLSGLAVEDSGQQEILNWMCLSGRISALDRKPKETGFVDTWIFNSSKMFLIAPPS